MRLTALLGCTVACVATALVGGRATASSVRSGWYGSLSKPPWQPPSEVFGPVWTILYGLIALSGALTWSVKDRRARPAKTLYAAQLALNAAWSQVFFARRSPAGGLAVIVVLLASIGAYVVAAWKASRIASWLFVPYALWVALATSLNAWIWTKNRGQTRESKGR